MDHSRAQVPGIIPARAGFTQARPGRRRRRRDHPRSRGVYPPPRPRPAATPGSSPLARGLRAGGGSSGSAGGIIPARAGFTDKSGHEGRDRGDHLRSRGVYSRPGRSCSGLGGSSPLARGLLQAVWNGIMAAGIIPARAGFTLHRRRRRMAVQDHPRSRGVYAVHGGVEVIEPGSSPLARGLLKGGPINSGASGIIPARAGFTRWSAGRCRRRGDHPRSRGVYVHSGDPVRIGPGSSPLARGLLAAEPAHRRTGRIIPARAGFTSYSDRQ